MRWVPRFGTIAPVFFVARSPSSVLSHPFFGEGSPTKVDYSKKGTLILTSPLEDLATGLGP